MIRIARQLWLLLSASERRRSAFLGLLLLINSLAEMSGVISVVPLVAAMTSSTDPCLRLGQTVGHFCSQILPSQNPPMIAAMVFGLIATSNMLAFATTWLSARLTWSVWRRLSASVLTAYMDKPYEFFFELHSSSAVKNIVYETERLAGSLFMPMLIVVSRLIVTCGVAVLIVTIDPLLSLIVIFFLSTIYYIVYRHLHQRVKQSGNLAFQFREQISRIASDTIAGIKELRMLGCGKHFYEKFRLAADVLARQYVYGITLSVLPRYIIETAALAAMLGLAGYLSIKVGGWQASAPILAFYVFAAYRLLPQFQQIFANSIIIQQNSNVADILYELVSSAKSPMSTEVSVLAGRSLSAPIDMEQVSYTYPGSVEPVLKDICMNIPSCLTVGLMGVTGAGKSTVIDLITGFLQPTEGSIKVNGVLLNRELAPVWRTKVGYVPQVPFLLDDTIRGNIAFGLPNVEIVEAQVLSSAKMANIHNFILSLPEGYETMVGEQGIKLSGGQRQRLAIARALYRNPEVLIFDEATSALDRETEQVVIDSIQTLSHKKTMLIISHRPASLKVCDFVYELANGKIILRNSTKEFPLS
ncbi:ABC transporter ATP-binding protein [Candidatus Nitronereus thalassa]|uniref:ABC transporter ATP-binding protein n=1 Tax=Candidatus Nitronereus thalassa TaxID=3020898 RepID=A0ABU3K5M4_9BACT|nr:ABC transporter ATP-binding protein [Candidatus Nitronereus thalassa]MDT7041662.1 ABC transporter ATP-binding protein [Candidatus Nitronereus thalassa]